MTNILKYSFLRHTTHLWIHGVALNYFYYSLKKWTQMWNFVLMTNEDRITTVVTTGKSNCFRDLAGKIAVLNVVLNSLNHESDQFLVSVNIFTSRVSGRSNRIGPACLSVRALKAEPFDIWTWNQSHLFVICVCVSIHHGKRTFKQKDCMWGDAGGTWTLRRFHFDCKQSPC